jgi:thiosulfate reductase cytochrome b subunit
VPSPPKFRETQTQPDDGGRPLPVRLTHWVNAFAMTCMIMSGWQIYNASPIFSITFPSWSTLGGWLAGGIAIHFAAMWLLVANGLFYLAYGLLSGYFRRTLLPLTPGQVVRDFIAALKFSLRHEPGIYNAVQTVRLLRAPGFLPAPSRLPPRI